MSPHTAFKSKLAKKKIISSYDKILSNWPIHYEERIVKTSFGDTYVIISGMGNTRPLILLHGGGGNSAMWIYNIAGLAKEFKVFCIDIIGEPGKSAGIRPKYNSRCHADWLKEVIDSLNINKINLCGASLGGLLAHKFALTYPDTVEKLALLAPPSLLPIRIPFIIKALLANLFPTDSIATSFFKYLSPRARCLSNNDKEIQIFLTNWQGYNPNNDRIPVITDEELDSLEHNTLLLLGEEELLYNPKKAFERVKLIAPEMKVKIIPNAGHVLSFDQPYVINKELLNFLEI
jgi:pimeloyl-ACP methyl ester carboxylesterase